MRQPTFQEHFTNARVSEAWRRERSSLREEKKLWRRGYKRVACLDEAGRGALCGPVIACAVLVNCSKPNFNRWRSDLNQVRDSKKLSAKQRKEFYKILTKHPAIEWGIGRASEKVIDRINILEATKLAMKKAVVNLEKKLIEVRLRTIKVRPHKIDFLILDGKMSLDLKIPQKSIVKADEKVFSCSTASIIAKVHRDRIMARLHKKYPRYGFAQHKGYPTKLHCKMLKKYGPAKIHRKTFKPIRKV